MNKQFSWLSCLNNPYLPQLIDAYNQIGALWVSRGDTKKGKLNLSRALKIHETIQKFDDGSSSKEDQEELRTIHIFTLFYLAQVEGQLGNAELSSGHVRKTLILQRENSDYEPVEWAINCAQLHNYYYNQLNLREAENCLLCAQEIANNDWLIAGATKDFIFDCDSNEKWNKSITNLGINLAYLSASGGEA